MIAEPFTSPEIDNDRSTGTGSELPLRFHRWISTVAMITSADVPIPLNTH